MTEGTYKNIYTHELEFNETTYNVPEKFRRLRRKIVLENYDTPVFICGEDIFYKIMHHPNVCNNYYYMRACGERIIEEKFKVLRDKKLMDLSSYDDFALLYGFMFLLDYNFKLDQAICETDKSIYVLKEK